jgi:DNA-binding CsgD family transcriptional regulator
MSQQVLPAPAAPLEDDVERALLQARALVDAAVSNHRRRATAPELIEPVPDEALAQTLRRMGSVAGHELLGVLPVDDDPPAVLDELKRLAAGDLVVRLLCAEGAMRFAARAEACGVQVRVARVALPELMLVDDRVALVRAPGGQPGLVTRAPAILRTLHGMFHGAWESARPVADQWRRTDLCHDELTRQILGCLGAGYKDDTAARKLGLSVRTYRRYVAELMREIGAMSRFQAGVRAAELGLVAPPARCA